MGVTGGDLPISVLGALAEIVTRRAPPSPAKIRPGALAPLLCWEQAEKAISAAQSAQQASPLVSSHAETHPVPPCLAAKRSVQRRRSHRLLAATLHRLPHAMPVDVCASEGRFCLACFTDLRQLAPPHPAWLGVMSFSGLGTI
jgi:hypothetical protein